MFQMTQPYLSLLTIRNITFKTLSVQNNSKGLSVLKPAYPSKQSILHDILLNKPRPIKKLQLVFPFPPRLIKRFPFISLHIVVSSKIFICGRSQSPVYVDRREENTEKITSYVLKTKGKTKRRKSLLLPVKVHLTPKNVFRLINPMYVK